MSAFATLPEVERRLFVEQVASRRGVVPLIIEKDFWVCWTLGRIFATPALGPHVVFKGGTSLFKVFGVISRFSEDIDLSVAPASLGFHRGGPGRRTFALPTQQAGEAIGRALRGTCARRLPPRA